jgi:hypothetical protein
MTQVGGLTSALIHRSMPPTNHGKPVQTGSGSMSESSGSSRYGKQNLLEFLKQSGMAGLINPATARSRRTAAEHLLTQLTEDEQSDLRNLDVDELCSRFHKLQGSTIRPESLRLYNSRLKAALADFIAWTDDPDGFVSVGAESRGLRKRSDTAGVKRSAEETALEEIKLGAPDIAADILPIPIRPDLVIYLQNIPLDLSPKEAGKISAVVQALAVNPDEDEA